MCMNNMLLYTLCPHDVHSVVCQEVADCSCKMLRHHRLLPVLKCWWHNAQRSTANLQQMPDNGSKSTTNTAKGDCVRGVAWLT